MNDREQSRGALVLAVWREILATTSENVRNFPAAQRAIAAGASVEDVVTAMQAASYETAFGILYLLSDRHAPYREEAPDVTRGWALVDFDLARDPSGPPSALDGVYEYLLEADPSGRGSADLWD